MINNNIKEIFSRNGTDKGTSHRYDNVYSLIVPYIKQHSCKNIMEIGYETGAGTKSFQEIFGSDYKYTALDLSFPDDNNDVNKIVVDTAYRSKLREVNKTLPTHGFSLIVDDASHRLQDQLNCLNELWVNLALGGIYLIENIYNLEHAYQFRTWPGFVVMDTRPIGQINDICIILRKLYDR